LSLIAFSNLWKNVEYEYGVPLQQVKALGISGMMHGYRYPLPGS
jgi:sugar (pentulose or hexulose) kinase